MAANVLRLRRSLALSSAILNHSRHFSVLPSVTESSSSPSTVQQNPSLFDITQSKANNVLFRFISSRSISSRSRYNNDDMDGDQISPDAILFEGCDYNHWLITMDFPKDPKPSPEEMVETYVQTAAKVLGSVEEAKKKIYACSTTTYNGFQVEVSEEVSEQFKSLPGVVFVLPDSYIDPVNKEYGGDKYINGTIIPRPPPVQYGRQGGRYNDRNREYNRPPRGQFEQSGGQGNYQRGHIPSNQVNYNQGEGRTYPQRDQGNYAQSGQRDFRGQGSNFTPPPGGGYNQGSGGGYRQGTGGQYDQGRGGQYGQGSNVGESYGQGTGGSYGQSGDGNYRQGGGNYGQGSGVGGGNYGQGGGGGGNYGYGQGGGGGGNYGQGSGGGGGDYGYGQGGDGGGNYGQGGGGGGNFGYGQGGGGGGNYGQGSGGGNYRQGGGGGNYRQGAGGNQGQQMGYGSNQTSPQYEENPGFSQVGERGNIHGQQGNYEIVEEAEAHKV
ncbi:hypothetical protein R6Q57_029553 [Mikania cordata]